MTNSLSQINQESYINASFNDFELHMLYIVLNHKIPKNNV
jgi:hypothetical protein